MSTPYQKYKYYFGPYNRRYWQTHPEYRERQKRIHRERYSRNKYAEVERTKNYIAAIYRNWFGGTSRTKFGKGIAFSAEKISVEKILPKEGFRNILWATSFTSKRAANKGTSAFWMFDAFAVKDGRRCAIQITTSPVRQIRNRAAVSAFLKFFDLTLYVLTVKPDLARYYLSKYDARSVPNTVMMTLRRTRMLRPV
jgi:hypothetical protein